MSTAPFFLEKILSVRYICFEIGWLVTLCSQIGAIVITLFFVSQPLLVSAAWHLRDSPSRRQCFRAFAHPPGPFLGGSHLFFSLLSFLFCRMYLLDRHSNFEKCIDLPLIFLFLAFLFGVPMIELCQLFKFILSLGLVLIVWAKGHSAYAASKADGFGDLSRRG